MSIWTRHLCNLLGKDLPASAKPGEFKCPICHDIVPLGELLTHSAAHDDLFKDGRMIARIKQDHPHWVETDGACPKCVEYYRRLVGVEGIQLPSNP